MNIHKALVAANCSICLL